MLTQNDLAFSDSDMWNFSSSIAFIRPPKTVGKISGYISKLCGIWHCDGLDSSDTAWVGVAFR